jgi:hypothetical protein
LIPTLNFDYLILGNSFSAVAEAHFRNLPILISKYNPPPLFHFFKSNVAQGAHYPIPNTALASGTPWRIFKFKIPGQAISRTGVQTREAYNNMLFLLGICGRNPFGDKIRKVHIVGEGRLEVYTDREIVPVTFKHLTIFDDDNVTGITPDVENTLPPKKRIYEVADRFVALSSNLTVLGFDMFLNKENGGFVKKVYTYKRGNCSKQNLKESRRGARFLVSISTLNEEELEMEVFSSNSVRIFLTRTLKQKHGVMGGMDKDYVSKSGEVIRYYRPNIRLALAGRTVYPKFKNRYLNTETVSFCYDAEKDTIIQQQMEKVQHNPGTIMAYQLCYAIKKMKNLGRAIFYKMLTGDYYGTIERIVKWRELKRKEYIDFLMGKKSRDVVPVSNSGSISKT